MRLTRRSLMAGGLAGVAMLAIRPAWALTTEQAKTFVEATVGDLVALLKTPGTAESRAPRLLQIMRARANLPQIAKFSAGRVWREMTPAQQQRFVAAFEHYVATTYARRFSEYSGNPDIYVGRAIDAGRKGILVETPIRQQQGQPVKVEWLVSDRGGKPEVLDIIIENVSMATTQREEIASMFDKRGGDVDALIADLDGAA